MILGIDPGLDGALALYQPSVGTIHEILDMPTFSLKRGKTNKREIDLDGVVQFLTTHREGISTAFIELVGPMPQQGVVSTYQFGRGVGQLEGILAAMEFNVAYLTPQKWQAHSKMRKGKDGSIKRARELFPDSTTLFTKGKHGRSDAALIAWVGSESG